MALIKIMPRRPTPSGEIAPSRRGAGPSFRLERDHGGLVAGIDEAGRGPLAGPVVAACVVLDPKRIPRSLNDSKKLDAETREQLFLRIRATATIGIGAASVAEIDRINILQATFLAMQRATQSCARVLGRWPDLALIDGNRAPKLDCAMTTVIGGDALCVSIAAASIIAKVTRDRAMTALARRHGGYGWETNMGYGTAVHRQALVSLGLTPHHRRSFAPVRPELPEQMDINL